MVRQAVEVLVEGASKTDPSRRFGRTPHNRTVNFDGEAPTGALVEVAVTYAGVGALSGTQGRLLSRAPVLIPETAQAVDACVV